MNFGSVLFAIVGALLMSGLFFLFKPAETPPPAQTVAAADAPASAPVIETPAVPQPTVVDIVVEKGRRVSGPDVVALKAGDEVVLNLTSDKDDELHLHGYDLHLHLKAGVTGTLKLTAAQSGRFSYELHKSHLELGALEVQPK